MLKQIASSITGKRSKANQVDSRRFQGDHDISYLTDEVVVLGFPAEGILRKSKVKDLQKVLDMMHAGTYRVYNLCEERQYPNTRFHGRVHEHPIPIDEPPAWDALRQVVLDINDWIEQDPLHIACVHCDVRKLRTCTVLASWLLMKKKSVSASQSIAMFLGALVQNSLPLSRLERLSSTEDQPAWGERSRAASTASDASTSSFTSASTTSSMSSSPSSSPPLVPHAATRGRSSSSVHNELQMLPTPSQRRYIEYFEKYVKGPHFPNQLPAPTRRLVVSKLVMNTIPNLNILGSCTPWFSIKRGNKTLFWSKALDGKKGRHHIDFDCCCTMIEGDIKIEIFNGSFAHPFASICFNTNFLPHPDKASFLKRDVDRAYLDVSHKHFSQDFRIDVHFKTVQRREKVSLEVILATPVLQDAYMAFLKMTHCHEILQFHKAVDLFRKLDASAPRKIFALKIYDMFVKTGSPSEINIGYELRNEVERNLSAPASDIFENCHKEVLYLMRSDSYQNFIQNHMYTTAMEAWDAQKKAKAEKENAAKAEATSPTTSPSASASPSTGRRRSNHVGSPTVPRSASAELNKPTSSRLSRTPSDSSVGSDESTLSDYEDRGKVDVMCPQCGHIIEPTQESIPLADGFYHWRCVTCSKCKQSLENKMNCLFKDGAPVCGDCDVDFFPRCASCFGNVTGRMEMIVGDNSIYTYHRYCFVCSVCQCGKSEDADIIFHKSIGALYCADHYPEQIDTSSAPGTFILPTSTPPTVFTAAPLAPLSAPSTPTSSTPNSAANSTNVSPSNSAIFQMSPPATPDTRSPSSSYIAPSSSSHQDDASRKAKHPAKQALPSTKISAVSAHLGFNPEPIQTSNSSRSRRVDQPQNSTAGLSQSVKAAFAQSDLPTKYGQPQYDKHAPSKPSPSVSSDPSTMSGSNAGAVSIRSGAGMSSITGPSFNPTIRPDKTSSSSSSSASSYVSPYQAPSTISSSSSMYSLEQDVTFTRSQAAPSGIPKSKSAPVAAAANVRTTVDDKHSAPRPSYNTPTPTPPGSGAARSAPQPPQAYTPAGMNPPPSRDPPYTASFVSSGSAQVAPPQTPFRGPSTPPPPPPHTIPSSLDASSAYSPSSSTKPVDPSYSSYSSISSMGVPSPVVSPPPSSSVFSSVPSLVAQSRCHGCGGELYGAILRALEYKFHETCFRCNKCKMLFGLDRDYFLCDGVFLCETCSL